MDSRGTNLEKPWEMNMILVSIETPPVLPRWTQDKFFAGHPDEPERDCHGKKLEDNLAGGRGEGLMLRVK